MHNRAAEDEDSEDEDGNDKPTQLADDVNDVSEDKAEEKEDEEDDDDAQQLVRKKLKTNEYVTMSRPKKIIFLNLLKKKGLGEHEPIAQTQEAQEVRFIRRR